MSLSVLHAMAGPLTSPSISDPPIRKPTTTARRWIAGLAFVAGLLIFAYGCYLETRNPRSNAEDNFAWLVLGIGVSLGSFGISLWFLRPIFACIIAVVVPPSAFCLAVVIFWVCLIASGLQNRNHQDFAADGVSQIAPAMQMDEQFTDCRHYITYGPNSVSLFNSVAYFGDRYELTMQVPVDIQSESTGTIIGNPQFYLNEVKSVSVSPSGQVGASFSRNLNFGIAKWQQVYDADGDFGIIGFNVNTTSVPDFRKYAAASRPSN